MIELSKRVTIEENVIIRQVGDEAVLLNLKTSQYYALNAVGCRMVQVLAECDSIAKAHLRLLEEYDVDSAELRVDLQDLIEALLKQELVRVD